MPRGSGSAFIGLLLLYPLLAAGHSRTADIDAYCMEVQTQFASASPYVFSGPDPWVQLEDVPTDMPDDGLAFVYAQGLSVRWVFVRMVNADAGWTEDIDYFFQEDGRIAKRIRHLQSAVSHISLEETVYYAGRHVVKTRTRHHAIGHHKPDNSQFSDPDAPTFWNVDDLPFPDLQNVWQRLI